jgi:hypothetical protein
MGWENRNGKRFYYRKRRQGRRVISEYIGSGPIAEFMATIVQRERQDQATQLMKKKQDFERVLNEDRELDTACDLVRDLTRWILLVSGFHAHKRQWRRRRSARNNH